MKNNEFTIYVEPEDATDLVIELSQADGIESQIAQGEITPPDFTKEHPSYHLDPTTTVAILVSLTSVTTGFLSLAKALLDYLASKNEAKTSKENKSKESTLVINTYIIRLSEKPTPEEVAKYIEENEVNRIFFE